jgi:hypothetical protein
MLPSFRRLLPFVLFERIGVVLGRHDLTKLRTGIVTIQYCRYSDNFAAASIVSIEQVLALTNCFYLSVRQGCGAGAGAGAGRSRNFWLEPEPELEPVY